MYENLYALASSSANQESWLEIIIFSIVAFSLFFYMVAWTDRREDRRQKTKRHKE